MSGSQLRMHGVRIGLVHKCILEPFLDKNRGPNPLRMYLMWNGSVKKCIFEFSEAFSNLLRMLFYHLGWKNKIPYIDYIQGNIIIKNEYFCHSNQWDQIQLEICLNRKSVHLIFIEAQVSFPLMNDRNFLPPSLSRFDSFWSLIHVDGKILNNGWHETKGLWEFFESLMNYVG